ncbi:MAG: hypothetical protein H7Z42_04670 [Roseiflexaceae bacterium]|nr:hypothetical protein [Roseiflexaceae bacterium]
MKTARFLTVKSIAETSDTLAIKLAPPIDVMILAGGVFTLGGLFCLITGGFLLKLLGIVLLILGISSLADLAWGRVELCFDKVQGLLLVRAARAKTLPLDQIRALVVAQVPKDSIAVPFRYELLLQRTDGAFTPLTLEVGAPMSYDLEPYQQAAERITGFLQLAQPVQRWQTSGWPAVEPKAAFVQHADAVR